MNAQLTNCPKCGKLFLKLRDFCNECFQKQENDYLIVSDYLRNHPNSTIHEVSEGTKVSVAQIRQFIFAKRILVIHFPNLSYPCDTCGNMITEGIKCRTCLEALSQLSEQLEKDNTDKDKEKNNSDSKLGGYMSRI